MAAANVPHIVKHMTLAIWRSGDIGGGTQERFVSAWNIARSRLVEYGYLQKGSEDGPLTNIKLTAKGFVREALHKREPGGKQKSAAFDKMFQYVEMAMSKEQKDYPDKDTKDDLKKADLSKKKVQLNKSPTGVSKAQKPKPKKK